MGEIEDFPTLENHIKNTFSLILNNGNIGGEVRESSPNRINTNNELNKQRDINLNLWLREYMQYLEIYMDTSPYLMTAFRIYCNVYDLHGQRSQMYCYLIATPFCVFEAYY